MATLKKYDKILYETLIEKDLVSKEVLKPIFVEAEVSDENFAQLLVKRNLFLEKDILNFMAEKLRLTCVNLKALEIDKSVINSVPVKIASYYKFIPVEIKDKVLTIAVSYPLDIKTQDEIRTQLGFDIEMALSCTDDILDNLKKYYGLGADTLQKITSQKTPAKPEGALETEKGKVEDIEKLVGDASVIRLVNQIILEGWRKRATDIHIEPYREGVALRYRIDGVLYDAPVPSEMKNFLSAIISRIKIMSNLNIVERRLPQDGRAIVRVQNQVLDLRISTMPTPFGESIVVRLLPAQMLFSLEKLGLLERELKLFEGLIKKPHGIVFITGPTGSGKTTTLYASLSKINTKVRKIITLEDPIEYEIAGITQIQIAPAVGLNFARGLRSVLRHDPDVIMVGEVRDLETAEIAVRIALTGHLVFSTLHTNDAASGVTRLVDIGVEPYLITSSVEAFIAQRLIRLICPDCKHEDKTAPKELRDIIARDLGLKKVAEAKIFRGKGCPNCNHTGFFGRTAIYEILLIDEEIKELILSKAPTSNVKKAAISKGMHTLRQDGWRKVIAGLTTPEEVMRVAPIEENKAAGETPGVFYYTNHNPSNPASSGETPFLPIGQERRVYKRLSSKVNIRYKAFKSVQELAKRELTPEHLSVSRNISAGGVLFISDDSLPVGAILELKIELPDGRRPIESLARVVRVEETTEGKHYDTAVCFLDITSAERTRLDKYIEIGGK